MRRPLGVLRILLRLLTVKILNFSLLKTFVPVVNILIKPRRRGKTSDCPGCRPLLTQTFRKFGLLCSCLLPLLLVMRFLRLMGLLCRFQRSILRKSRPVMSQFVKRRTVLVTGLMTVPVFLGRRQNFLLLRMARQCKFQKPAVSRRWNGTVSRPM